ncbi:tripartite ATP-independent transporter solute receptor, DctP family [Pseudobutyrivibrio sp. YE44]|uniref:TRAP transporter substrate-binding protein n=1 Tax=Pseudobutyrivibrio sp. YE44 TaxID=1520802 RepID=UPI0008925597|nr:TRAP transporter substrate-binding protein [Pseudobutyrivibrio sp. YE44]SDB24503.1 tripartite ATP-independent transporter solute receptor, DctP family [Pseudobutyrivibrio sp. YE44]
MKKRCILTGIAAIAVLACTVKIIFFSQAKVEENAPEYVFYYADNQTEDYPTTLGDQKFADLVYERTDGRIKILVKCDSQLGSEEEVIEQLKYGGIAFARVSNTQLAEKVPELSVLNLPYLYNDSNHMWRVLDGKIGDEYLSKVQKYDLIGLSWYDAGARSFYSTEKAIKTVEDCQGMNIRVQKSAMMSDMVSALGANPVEIDYSNVYSALEKGTVDGAENNWPSYEAKSHYKLAKYFTVDEHMRIPEMQICSKVVWNRLDQNDRDIIKACAIESATYERTLWNQRENEAKLTAVKNGTQVISLSPEEKQRFRDAMLGVYEKYCGNYMDEVTRIIECE